ncbi:CoA-acylating methylmalonate-semialdehyde dehydrogenase [Clostridiales bacterium COT073_COT-073]|nr:CoA-acylating methylmalonate-semialdehyde dehydrogenase [Clostridiales bacterium COT073_COT-073]
MRKLKNYINGKWLESQSMEYLAVHDPSTEEILAECPLSQAEEVNQAAAAAHNAFLVWRKTSPLTRSKILFRLYALLQERHEELAEIICLENGKSYTDAYGEVQRGIENLENACAIVNLIMGDSLATVATDVEVTNYKYPVGVVAAITPFNFPMMVPFWIFPMAIACGNTVVLKPSEKTPLLIEKIVELAEKAGVPAGVLNIVNGAKDTVNAILEEPLIKAISFVGSEQVGRHIYEQGCANFKRVQVLGGAKNHTIILKDADLEDAAIKVTAAGFGSAGQRCMAGSVVLVEEEIAKVFLDKLLEKARKITIGNPVQDHSIYLGPVIDQAAKDRIFKYIDIGQKEGANLLLDGRQGIPDKGYFVGPTIFNDCQPGMKIWQDEIFGPLICVIQIKSLQEGVEIANSHHLANGACLFTNNASAVRYFRENIDAGMIGINLGVPAPIAWFAFSGWKDSFFGDLHCNGKDSVAFFTRRKVVTAQYKEENK